MLWNRKYYGLYFDQTSCWKRLNVLLVLAVGNGREKFSSGRGGFYGDNLKGWRNDGGGRGFQNGGVGNGREKFSSGRGGFYGDNLKGWRNSGGGQGFQNGGDRAARHSAMK
ncbi:hypothetical protein F0562_032990 [Nyssa sinensis]|uniref:Uncharacterized protein n=1 Tax=Nyssa sinensis TaxID=561372 RepID=A0A5J5APG5_9ASTE|nr:hypothetical protein F0562_032990 [Nyssa sinensis]